VLPQRKTTPHRTKREKSQLKGANTQKRNSVAEKRGKPEMRFDNSDLSAALSQSPTSSKEDY
jgi:hypothetical protein